MNNIKKEKSSIEMWAEEEVRIACERQRHHNGHSGDEWNYDVVCYESALKAFRSLLEDGHSGTNIGITLRILNRLVKEQPLTPIEDTDDVWIKCELYPYEKDCDTYQCKRMSSLFKDVYDDGHIEYLDIDRFICMSLDNSTYWYNNFVAKIAGEYFPVTMPYMPKTYKVFCEKFLTDRANGDYDTIGILYILDSAGELKEVNRHFAVEKGEWREIDLSEYEQRRQMNADRKAAEKKEFNCRF